MTGATAHCSVNSLFYSATSTIIRYIFVRTSLQPDIQEVLKRDAFVYKSIFTVESLGCYNLVTFFLIQWGKRGQEKSKVLLYQSCFDPWKSSFSTPFFKVMSLNQLLVFIAAFCIIGFNLVLFTHLDKQSKNNTAISVTDQVCKYTRCPEKMTLSCLGPVEKVSFLGHPVLLDFGEKTNLLLFR